MRNMRVYVVRTEWRNDCAESLEGTLSWGQRKGLEGGGGSTLPMFSWSTSVVVVSRGVKLYACVLR